MGIVRWFSFYSRRNQMTAANRVYIEIEKDVYDVLHQIRITDNPDPESSFADCRGRNQHELEFLKLVLSDSFGISISVEDLKGLDTVRKVSSYIGSRQDAHIL